MALNDREMLLVYEHLNRVFREDLHISRPLVRMLRAAGKEREASEHAFLTAQRMVSSHLPGSALGFLEICRQIGHPSEEEVDSLAAIAELTAKDTQKTGRSRLFSLIAQLSDQEGMDFIRHGNLLRFDAGRDVLRQGEISDSFYLILDGAVHIHMQVENVEFSISTLHRGDFFGEFASVYHLPRSATATTLRPCLLLEFSESDIQRLMRSSPLAGEYLLNVVRQRMVHSMSRGHAALADLDEIDRDWLAERSTVLEFPSQSRVIAERLPAGHWVVLFIGSMRCQGERGEEKRLEVHDMFPSALLHRGDWKDLRAIDRTFVYCIPDDVFVSFRNAYLSFDEWVVRHVPGAAVKAELPVRA